MDDPYHNNINQQGETYPTYGEGGEYTYPYQTDFPPQEEEDAASDVTEGHDEDDQMYEGEYQGIPHPDEIKEARRAARREARMKARMAAEVEEETLPEQYESIMEDCGHGRFQWTLFTVLGLALMADGVECFVVSFALPSAEKDMCLSNADKGMLGLIVYVGMMIGAVLWGGLADKLGRRQCLLYALAINCIFSFLSCFAQGYGFFIFFRLCSGIGIGGSIPVVYTYFAEFLQMDKRGEHLSWLCLFWMLGGLYASFTAWGIIPHYGWGFSMGTEFQFHSWRVFVLVCFLPSVAALAGLVFMPESPRFLLETARHDEAWMILRQVHDTNWRAKGEPERVFQVSQIKMPQTQDDEFIEIQSETGTAFQRFMSPSCLDLVNNDLSVGVSYYGLGAWFPDQIKYLQFEEYESNVKIFHREKVERFHFNFTLQNQVHKEGEYIHDRYIYLFIYNLWEDSKFINCKLHNTTFLHPKKGCHLNFQEENDIVIYLVSFLGSLSVLPGNIIAGLLMDKIGRLKIIGGSMLGSALCTFFLLLCFSQWAVVLFQCLFFAAGAAAWNGIEVITVELYPASKRATAFGVLNGTCKLAAIISTFIFGKFIGITKIIPIILSFSALVCGGLLAFKLPETREVILQ
ncbi:Synaptic vesicle glycoprotein 2B [Labeo rohita]|uniref:Synaptic vesicle glycoprotein 2B n=1 Tax=Labeo rohita TaxID=84645 RepID=A0ABQ8ML29_LABRO|nr:Synaptic vesicle glycoprotein 2B [Labeo rohita]